MVSFFRSTDQDAGQKSSGDSSQNSSTASGKPLDIVFLQDTTGSQGPYILAAKKAIRDICDKISESGDLSKDLIRFGLIAFRDHPPQDNTYVTKSFGFTSDIEVMHKNLASLVASGGGDGPEAQTAALARALDMEWADNAIKMVILITDAPPHGIGEVGDGFTKSPDQNDPLQLARQMTEHGITLFVVACEPALSKYRNAVDFYTALVQITGGKMFPLLMADKLGDYIVGLAVETIETEQLIGEFEQVIVDEVYEKEASMDAVAEQLQRQLQERGTKINSIEVENIYNESETSKKNVVLWQHAENIAEVVGKIEQSTVPRLQSTFTEVETDTSYVMKRRNRASIGHAVELAGDPSPTLFRARGAVKLSSSSRKASRDVSSSIGTARCLDDITSVDIPRGRERGPQVQVGKSDINMLQSRRVVQQALARQSAVNSTEYVSKSTGKSVSLVPSAWSLAAVVTPDILNDISETTHPSLPK